MANRTNASVPYYIYEYYLDYLDPIPVDEKKLKANKYSIVIAFWVSLAAFVVFLFLILLYMSWSGTLQLRSNHQNHHPCSWTHRLNLPSCIRSISQGTPEEPRSEPGAGQRLRRENPSASPPVALSVPFGEQAVDGESHGAS
ncbi:melanocortin-2 receptor accessory protein [Perognathus longimembris pacificus]|uniref:melanocortin-2 receptor accessory protein n=1 Tax=Perognathus longimembris pacificus TaxID=214514 RepID=UPI0020192F56|nr:melanocortin-2 receptor accessory protein [Perognathus longimembris pacificus]